MNCIGHQETVEEMRANKTEKFKELKRGDAEFEEWFLRYRPIDVKTKKEAVKENKTNTNKTKKKKSNKNKTQKKGYFF